jgi:glycosyltransferase involved in cell wall biosynthesis
VRDWLEERGRSWEILIVDNASDDRTDDVLAPMLEDSRIRLLRNEHNRGKGFSVRRGMLEASGGLRLMCDADCAPSLPSLPRMVELSEEFDVVAGSRLAAGADVTRAQPLARRLAGKAFLTLCRVIMREPSRDIFCGFKLFRGEAAAAGFSRQSLEGWTFDVEVLAIVRGLGYSVTESGIVWNNREDSRLSMRRVLLPVVRELVRARRHVDRVLASPPPAAGAKDPLANPRG